MQSMFMTIGESIHVHHMIIPLSPEKDAFLRTPFYRVILTLAIAACITVPGDTIVKSQIDSIEDQLKKVLTVHVQVRE